MCAVMVGVLKFANDFPGNARIGTGFLGDERDGFAPEAHSTTNIQTRTGPQGRFFVARNRVSARDFARFCRCHACQEHRQNVARFASLFLSFLHLPSLAERFAAWSDPLLFDYEFWDQTLIRSCWIVLRQALKANAKGHRL